MNYAKLRLLSLKESPLAFSDSYEDELKRNSQDYQMEIEPLFGLAESFILGCFTPGNSMVGFVKFVRDKRTKARHKAYLHSLYMKPEFRGKGFGKQLIRELFEAISPLDDLEQIHLWVLISETSAVEFYQSCGFRNQGTLVQNDLKIGQQYVDAMYMVKYL